MEYNSYHIGGFVAKLIEALFADLADMQVTAIRINDQHELTTQKLPRVIVQRGGYQTNVQFIGSGHEDTSGDVKKYRQDTSGMFAFIVESRQEGECELIADYLCRFLCWCRPMIERKFGAQRFAHSIDVSPCEMDKEDTEKFKITISVPYIVEDRWKVTDYSTRISHIFRKLEGM